MMEYKHTKEAGRLKTEITASGSPSEIIDDICNLVNSIYLQMMEHSPIDGALFKATVMFVIGNTNSPVWDKPTDGTREMIKDEIISFREPKK